MSSVPVTDIPWAFRPTGLDDIPFVAFDTETTGLHASDRLVELAGVRFRGEEVEAEWTSLVNPGVPIPEAASSIHGLRDGDVAAAPLATAVLPAFLGFIQGAALVGHNSPFDVRVLALELLRAGLPLPDNPVLDTCALSRRLGLDVPNHRLGTLAQALGVRCGTGHRALADARVARELLRAYLQQLGDAAEGLVRRDLTLEPLLLSFRRFAGEPIPDSPLVSLMRRARAEGRAVLVVPAGGGPRPVVPRDLYVLGGTLYVEADCLDDGSVRTFAADQLHLARLDRS
jgi:DNA polymerase III subunit epsilon